MHPLTSTPAEIAAGYALAVAASLALRRSLRRGARRIARRGSLHDRLLKRRTVPDPRLVSRADALARLGGRIGTSIAFSLATLFALERIGIDLVLVISSAGFLGLALALSGQGLIRDLLAGTRSLIEDRYAVGDRVTLRLAGTEVAGTVDQISSASIRITTDEGATCHVGHDAIECLINHSQHPATTTLTVPASLVENVDAGDVKSRLIAASNDVGLTGVVFVGDVANIGNATADADQIEVQLTANRPLSEQQAERVRQHLLSSADEQPVSATDDGVASRR